MGWLLTLVMTLPMAGSDVEIHMWFSRRSYCNFALEKFSENPILHRVDEAPVSPVTLKSIDCRKLAKDEAHLIPPHMR